MSAPRVRALITGGAGFIGSHLAETLLARGDRVSIIDDLSTGSLDNLAAVADHPDVEVVVDTVMNLEVLDSLMGACDVVFHMAAVVGVRLVVEAPGQVIESNVLGTHGVLQLARKHGTKVVLASTSEVYGKNTKLPFSEDDDRLMGPTTVARWGYAESKAIDEFMALAYHHEHGVPVVIARLFNTVGPRQTGRYGMVVPRFVRQALDGERLTVYGDGGQSRCFCNVEDAVRALVALSDEPEAIGEVVNIGTTEVVTILELARRVIEQVNPAGAEHADGVVLVPYDEAYPVGFEDMRQRQPDISKIRSLVGWEPTIPLTETIRRVIASQPGERS
jgi:UDP-glucose 4-epimerase